MSGGRWVREPNGDYQHYTDEEYGAMLFNNWLGNVGFAIFIGFCLIYYSYDICQWGNFNDFNFDLFCVGCVLTIGGGLLLKINGVSTGEIFGTYTASVIIIAIIVFVYKKYIDTDENEEKKQDNTEEVVNNSSESNSSNSSTYNSTAFENYESVEENNDYEVEEYADDEVSVEEEYNIAGPSDDGYNHILSERELTDADINGLSSRELELMRNSIYARYGYKFNRDDLIDHFSNFSWYRPTTTDMSSVYEKMSDIERYNTDFIRQREYNER